MSLLVKRNEKQTAIAGGGEITVRALREWLASLPEEFQDAQFESCWGGMPLSLKRIVAYRAKDEAKLIGVCANSMGSHLPFDDSLTWEHVLS